MEGLTERQEKILRIVLKEYIATGRPVASKAIAQEFGLEVSPATIRNELAELEERAFLTHPHTSAGRVPTEAGYHYFVEFLLEEVELPMVEQRMILHQFHHASLELEEWMKLAAAVLARTAQNAAVVAPPRAERSRFRRLELVLLTESLTLAILITEQGTVKKRFILAPEVNFSSDDMRRVSNHFDALLTGLECKDLAAKLPQLSPLERTVLDCVVSMMEEADSQRAGAIYQDGLMYILRQPELAERKRVQQALELLEDGQVLGAILSQSLAQSGVQVVIGGEARWEEMSHFSLVMSRYGLVDRALGAVGVLGPLRMPYARAISAVRYIAGLMSDLVSTMYMG